MTDALQLAENLAFDAYMRYHRNRMTLSTSDVDQLRTYDVVDRGENFVILYKNGMDAGKSCIYATINKETCKVCSNYLPESNQPSIDETNYLLSIPGMRESILEGMATPIEELFSKEDLEW